MKSQQIDFGTESVSVLFRKMFIPTVLGMLSVSAVTMIDGIFVGHGVGSDGIAAVNICIPLLMVIQGIGMMAGAGCSVLASISLSHGKQCEARAHVTNAMLFVTVLALAVLLIIYLAPERVAYMLGSSQHLLPMVLDYLLWFAPSLLFQVWLSVALLVIRLDGAPRLAMWCSITSAIVNAMLDWLFIFPLGMGVCGAAIATSICCLVGASIAMAYLLFYAQNVRLHRLYGDIRGVLFFLRDMATQGKIGFSAFLGEATLSITFFVGNHVFMHYLGDDGVAAFGISCYYMPFAFMIGNAIAQSAQPIISYNFGLGNDKRVHIALNTAFRAALCCGLIPMTFFMFLPKALVMLFLSLDTPAADMAVYGFPYYGLAFIFMVINLTVIGYYQSIERVRPSIMFAMLRGVVFLLPCFLLLPEVLGTKGIWLALPLSECLTTCVIMMVMLWHSRHHRTVATQTLPMRH